MRLLHSHFLTKWQIHQMFTKGGPITKRRRLIKLAEACEKCRPVLRRYYHAEGFFGGEYAVVSIQAMDRMAQAILENHPSKRPLSKRISKPLGVVVPATALLVLSLLFIPSIDHRVPVSKERLANAVELRTRGAELKASADFGIRVFALRPSKDRILEQDRVYLNDLLTFTYTRAHPGPGYLAIFGIQPSRDDVIWYYPDYGEVQSIRIDGDRVDEPLGDGFALSVNHQPGELLIVALFSSSPISSEAIEKVAEENRRHGTLAETERLDLFQKLDSGAVIHSVLLTLKEKQNE